MRDRKTRALAVTASILLLGGCAVQSSELQTLKEQVRIQQKQLVDLQARQEEHQAKLEILDNGFKILGDKVDDNSRRLEETGSLGRMAPPPVASRPLQPAPAAPGQPQAGGAHPAPADPPGRPTLS